MNDLKTPVSRLARVFRDARDRWKAKALARQQCLRAAQVRIRDLEHSRAYWKARALAAEGQAPARAASGGDTDEDGGEEPPPALVPTRLTNHHHCLEVMQLSLQLYLRASFGCRGVNWVLRLLSGYLPLGVPASTTVLNWCYRLGLAVLQRPLPRRDDWIFVIDHTVALGALKCLVVLGIPVARLAETGYSPRHRDMTVLAVEVTASSTGVWVAAVLEQVSARTGVPVQIVADHGSDVRKGIALFRQQAPRCVETYDISHAIATQLKAHWRDDEHWQGFVQQTQGDFALANKYNRINTILSTLDFYLRMMYKGTSSHIIRDNGFACKRSPPATGSQRRRSALSGTDAAASLPGSAAQDWGNPLVCRHLARAVDCLGELFCGGLEVRGSGSMDRLGFPPPIRPSALVGQ
jgi:hypothetical protein